MQYEEFRTQLTMDAKGRLTLPVQLRNELSKRDVERLVGISEGGRLLLFTPDDYRRIVKGRVQNADPFAPQTATYLRAVVSTNTSLPLDSHGRVLLSPHLRELAGLEKDLVVFSSLNWIEVWDKGRYDQQFQQALVDWERQRGGGE